MGSILDFRHSNEIIEGWEVIWGMVFLLGLGGGLGGCGVDEISKELVGVFDFVAEVTNRFEGGIFSLGWFFHYNIFNYCLGLLMIIR